MKHCLSRKVWTLLYDEWQINFFYSWTVQSFGLPLLSPYLQSIGSDFQHGANYASDAGTALKSDTSLYESGISPFYLDVQVREMADFKVRVLEQLPKGMRFEISLSKLATS